MNKEIVIPAQTEHIDKAADFVESCMRQHGWADNIALEYRMLAEELLLKLIEAAGPGEELKLQFKRYFGTAVFTFRCKGTPVNVSQPEEDLSSMILSNFSERITQAYRHGSNRITLSTGTSSSRIMIMNLWAVALAVIVCLLMRLLCDEKILLWVESNITFPISFIFARAVQIIAAPVAFFSLVANIAAGILYMSDEHSFINIIKRFMFSSAMAIISGIAAAWAFSGAYFATEDLSAYVLTSEAILGNSVGDALMNIIPSNIFDLFTLRNPLPLIITAFVTGVGAASVFGNSGHRIRQTFRDIKLLLCNILNLVYQALPLILFFSVLDTILSGGVGYLKIFGVIILSVLAGIILLALMYMINLLCHGIRPDRFFREYREIILENLRIGSNVDAKPYNYRMLRKKLSLSKTRLKDYLDLGSMVNMDGNCLILAVIAMAFVFVGRIDMGVGRYIEMFIVILALGIGAPNQPGTVLIGGLVLMPFLGIGEELIGSLVIIEAINFKLGAFANSLGDLVQIVCIDANDKQNKKGSRKKAGTLEEN